MERIALFIDGPSTHHAAKTLGLSIDFRRVLTEFQKNARLVRAFYYTTLVEDADHIALRPMVDWLDYNGFTVVTKPAKEFTDALGRRRLKGNMDIELAVDAMELASRIDHMVLFSGDGDFRSLVAAVQRRGVRTTAVSTLMQGATIADELRRQADAFIDLESIAERIVRTAPPRPGTRRPD